MANSLRKNFSWVFLGNGVRSACQWGTVVLIAKLSSPEVLGRYAYALALVMPVYMFWNVNLRAVYVSDAKQTHSFSSYVRLRGATTVLALTTILLLSVFIGMRGESLLVCLFLGMILGIESLADSYHGRFQKSERMDLLALSWIFRAPLGITAVGLALFLGHNLSTGLLLGMALQLPVYLFWDRRNFSGVNTDPASENSATENSASVSPKASKLLAMFFAALPLGLATLLLSIETNLPRLSIRHVLGEDMLGIFAAMLHLVLAGRLIVRALAYAAVPRIARLAAKGEGRGLIVLVGKLLGIGGFLGGMGLLVVTLAGGPILTLLYRPEYAKHAEVFIWLMGASIFAYLGSFLGEALTAMRLFSIQLKVHVCAVILCATCSWLFIPSRGLVGAAQVFVVLWGFHSFAYFCIFLKNCLSMTPGMETPIGESV